jgi:hypothetical protein
MNRPSAALAVHRRLSTDRPEDSGRAGWGVCRGARLYACCDAHRGDGLRRERLGLARWTFEALPIIWAGNPVWELGYDKGSIIHPISLPREQEGDIDCRANNDKGGTCEVMYMGNPGDKYSPAYSYHYVYGVTHDLP